MILQNSVFLFIGLFIGLIVGLLATNKRNQDKISKNIEDHLNDFLPKITQLAGTQTALIAKEKLEATTKESEKDLQSKKELIDETLKRIQQDLKDTNLRVEKAQHLHVDSFSKLTEQMSAQKDQVENLRKSTDGLKNVLSNNQMRGVFGEQIAEDLLKMAGFSRGLDYDMQTGDRESRPDFTVKLPNGMKINIDVKFPYNNLKQATDTDNPNEKATLLKAFERDIKEKIKQVTSRNYIDPSTRTVDFVILFVPNELIFSYIYDKMNDVWLEAMKQKVVLAGPFSFTAILRMVRQAYETFHIQANIQTIITNIKLLSVEYQKEREEFEKMGRQLGTVQNTYTELTTTRANKLQRIMDKIQSEDEGGLFEVVATLPKTLNE